MMDKHIYFFIGTTAEFIKLAPVIKELKKRKINFKLITSGQSEIRFEELKGYLGPIKADIAFNIKSYSLSIPHFLLWAIRTFFICLSSLRKEFNSLNNDNRYLIVHGDTISSLMGALIAKIYRLKLVHIESGLRSFNFLEPFPEEIDRFIITYLADIRFCQNEWALKNVKNLRGININTKQNTLIESYWWAIKEKQNIDYIKKLKKYFVLYIRRQEHIFFKKEYVRKVLKFVINNVNKDLNCFFLLHPLTSKFLQLEKIDLYNQLKGRLLIKSRLPYVEFMKLLYNAEFLVSDGCTNQEEAYYMGLPFLVLRNRTERMEGLGENVAISKGNKKVIKEFLQNYKKYRKGVIQIRKRPSSTIANSLIKS